MEVLGSKFPNFFILIHNYVVLSSDLISQLFATENAKKLVSVTFITKLASRMYPFSDSLEQVLNPDPSIFSEKCKHQVQSLGEKSRRQLKCTVLQSKSANF